MFFLHLPIQESTGTDWVKKEIANVKVQFHGFYVVGLYSSTSLLGPPQK